MSIRNCVEEHTFKCMVEMERRSARKGVRERKRGRERGSRHKMKKETGGEADRER